MANPLVHCITLRQHRILNVDSCDVVTYWDREDENMAPSLSQAALQLNGSVKSFLIDQALAALEFQTLDPVATSLWSEFGRFLSLIA